MISIEDARDRIGAGVVYQPYPDAPREDGTITSVTETAHQGWIFVLYTGDRNPKATRPEDLDWLRPTRYDLVPKCSSCGRLRTLDDAYDYNPIQAITGRQLGWYSGDDGEMCPECMTGLIRGRH